MKKFITSLCVLLVGFVAFLIIYYSTHVTVPSGYVGYVYDRNAKQDDNVIVGTSVINEARTGRFRINPITQDVQEYPTTRISRNFTGPDEGEGNGDDMSFTVSSVEGQPVNCDVYITLQLSDIPKVIQAYGRKNIDDIVDNDIYGLIRGKLSLPVQKISVYDVQSSVAVIQKEVKDALGDELESNYGISLITFEIGNITPPLEIQQKINEKTNAINAVELAKLERQKQEEINQQTIDAQKAQSEKEMLQRQAQADAAAYEKQKEADAVAYEITKTAEANLAAQEAELKIAELAVEQAKLEKEAELEKQKAYSEAYFRDKELDIQKAAVQAINPSVKTIVTSGDGEGYEAIFGLKEIFGGTN